MKIPNKLKIGGHVYTIEFVKKEDLKGLADEMDCGMTLVGENRILIDGGQKKSQQEETLFHELLHALNGTMNHDFLASLAQQLHQVFSDNKLLK